MRIVVFARAPIAGRAKTRLSPALGADGAAALAGAMIGDVVAACASIEGLEPEVHVDGPIDHAVFAAIDGAHRVVPQSAGAIGRRMHDALVADGRDGPALLVGTDVPTLPRALVRAARDALTRGAELVLTPAADGGFPLVGASAPARTAFLCGPAIRWSTRHALADTIRAARDAGLRATLTAPWYDVDDPADLRLLRAHLALDPGAAPRTHAALSRSILF